MAIFNKLALSILFIVNPYFKFKLILVFVIKFVFIIIILSVFLL